MVRTRARSQYLLAHPGRHQRRANPTAVPQDSAARQDRLGSAAYRQSRARHQDYFRCFLIRGMDAVFRRSSIVHGCPASGGLNSKEINIACETQLRRVLSRYAIDCSRARTDFALRNEMHWHRAALRPGAIVRIPILAGYIKSAHEYEFRSGRPKCIQQSDRLPS